MSVWRCEYCNTERAAKCNLKKGHAVPLYTLDPEDVIVIYDLFLFRKSLDSLQSPDP